LIHGRVVRARQSAPPTLEPAMNLILALRVAFFLLVVGVPLYRVLRIMRAQQRHPHMRDGRVIVDESKVVDSTLVESEEK